MKNNDFFRISPDRTELVWGTRYLLFQTVFLSSLLSALNWILPFTLNRAQLNFLFFAINFSAVLVIFRKFLLQFLQTDGKGWLRIGIVALVFFGLNQLCSMAMGHLLIRLEPEFANTNDQNIAAMSQNKFALMFIGTVILVPVYEECLFRGLIFRGMYSRRPALAWIFSVVAFGTVHLLSSAGSSPWMLFLNFLQYIPAGLCLAAAYRLSGSLICPILIHAAVNAMGMMSLR